MTEPDFQAIGRYSHYKEQLVAALWSRKEALTSLLHWADCGESAARRALIPSPHSSEPKAEDMQPDLRVPPLAVEHLRLLVDRVIQSQSYALEAANAFNHAAGVLGKAGVEIR